MCRRWELESECELRRLGTAWTARFTVYGVGQGAVFEGHLMLSIGASCHTAAEGERGTTFEFGLECSDCLFLDVSTDDPLRTQLPLPMPRGYTYSSSLHFFLH